MIKIEIAGVSRSAFFFAIRAKKRLVMPFSH